MIKKNMRSFCFYSEAYLYAQGDAWWKGRWDSKKLGWREFSEMSCSEYSVSEAVEKF